MRKRSSYRPQGANPQAWIVAMQGASLLSKSDQASRAMKVHLAVDAIRRGEASTDEWRDVFDALNMVEAFAGMPSVMQGASEFVQHQQETIVAILDRQKATGSKALKAIDKGRGSIGHLGSGDPIKAAAIKKPSQM